MSDMLTRKNTQGSCMVSTIRNLLCILCRNDSGEINPPDTLRRELKDYCRTDLNGIVAGTTNPETLAEFARSALLLHEKYEPSFALFISSLIIMLPNGILSEINVGAIPHRLMLLHGLESEWMERIKETPRNYRASVLKDYSEYNFFEKYSDLLAGNFISNLFTKITY